LRSFFVCFAIGAAAGARKEEAIAGLLEPVTNQAMAQPLLVVEDRVKCLNLISCGRVDHGNVLGGQLFVQVPRRVDK
jgi:hypothetical protein